jgi:hypothetical protein
MHGARVIEDAGEDEGEDGAEDGAEDGGDDGGEAETVELPICRAIDEIP